MNPQAAKKIIIKEKNKGKHSENEIATVESIAIHAQWQQVFCPISAGKIIRISWFEHLP